MDYEQFWRNSEDNFYEESFTYDTLKRTSIPISSIDYIQLDNGFLPGFLSDGFAVTGVVSVLTTLFVAPLVSIDKDSPYRFNSKRYTRIVIPALIGSVVGWTAYGLLGKHNGKKLKL